MSKAIEEGESFLAIADLAGVPSIDTPEVGKRSRGLAHHPRSKAKCDKTEHHC